MALARHELVLGGQRSGKSRCAEARALAWLAAPGHSAVLLATALGGDDEMRERIRRHQQDRARRVPDLAAEEVPRELARALDFHSAPGHLVVIDCLTLWLTNLLLPIGGAGLDPAACDAARSGLCTALQRASGPVLQVSNQVDMSVTPVSAEARRFVDELGWLHPAVAAQCASVTLMVAGIELPVKREGVV